MDFQDTLDEMNITLGDTDNVTFTPEEKIRALTKAWKDSYVIVPVTDATLSFTRGTYQQTLPEGISSVTGISLSPANSLITDFPTTIDTNMFSVSGGSIQWRNQANGSVPNGYTLYLTGNYKLDPDTDTLDDAKLQEYVIALGAYNTLTLLGYKKVNLFLKNDTTIAELIALKRELRSEVAELRGSLARAYEGA